MVVRHILFENVIADIVFYDFLIILGMRRSVLCISLFNCIGFSNVGKAGVGGSCGCS